MGPCSHDKNLFFLFFFGARFTQNMAALGAIQPHTAHTWQWRRSGPPHSETRPLFPRQERIKDSDVEVEIVFPVAADAVAPQPDEAPEGGLAVVPGAAGAEGCSAAGGCATCPFMKVGALGVGATRV